MGPLTGEAASLTTPPVLAAQERRDVLAADRAGRGGEPCGLALVQGAPALHASTVAAARHRAVGSAVQRDVIQRSVRQTHHTYVISLLRHVVLKHGG